MASLRFPYLHIVHERLVGQIRLGYSAVQDYIVHRAVHIGVAMAEI